MKFLRLFLVLLGCCLAAQSPLSAQDASSPFVQKQYSADMVLTTGNGQSMTQKIYSDGGKIRTEMSANGIQIISIARPDIQKFYTIMPEQKMVMALPYEAKRQQMGAAMPTGKSDLIGPDSVDGAACIKYKITSDDNKVFYFWIDAEAKTPKKMAAEDGSFVTVWKNFSVGPQDSSLFEPPAGYQIMNMPSGMGMPGGGMPGGGLPGGVMPKLPGMPGGQ